VENESDAVQANQQSLAGWCVVTFEARMGNESRRLFERQGATVISAPAIQEVPLADQSSALQFGEQLINKQVEVLVLLTGVGTRLLIDVLCTRWEKSEVLAALKDVQLVCRGPKPVAALKEYGLKPDVVVAEPNTWRDVVTAFDDQDLGRNKRIWVQEYGRPNAELVEALSSRAKTVETVALYGWTMPDDLSPLKSAIAAMIAGTAKIACFTTGVQADHLLELAHRLSLDKALRQALIERIVIASIGPLTTERLAFHGFAADIEPEHPKLGHLVLAVAARARDAMAQKNQPRGTNIPE
jgi:uroporphyrinogen-III synthase